MARAKLDSERTPSSHLLDRLERFSEKARLDRCSRIVVGFSAGNDSTALLWGLTRVATSHGFSVLAAHLDHGLTSDSASRARRATALARSLGVRCKSRRVDIRNERRRGESIEAAARRIRYLFLEDVRKGARAVLVATAHHRNDQLETLVIRLLQGTGLRGLAGIRRQHRRVARPLLSFSRAALESVVDDQALPIVEDPTNRNTRYLRNSVRRQLIPRLEDPAGLAASAESLADAASGARTAINRRLATHLDLRKGLGGTSLNRTSFERLPAQLRPWALALLHQHAGAHYPPRRRAREELMRQLGTTDRQVGCDCCSQWRWEASRERLRLRPKPPKSSAVLIYSQDSG